MEKLIRNINIKPWKDFVLPMVKEKFSQKIREKLRPKQTKPMLYDTDIKSYLEALNESFAVVIIDKTANNFAFLCVFTMSHTCLE